MVIRQVKQLVIEALDKAINEGLGINDWKRAQGQDLKPAPVHRWFGRRIASLFKNLVF
jgi:hypothetical protein